MFFPSCYSNLTQGVYNMSKRRRKLRLVRGDNMKSTTMHNGKFSLAEFIKSNQKVIDSVTPVNPFISKDDEWRNDSYDKFFKEVDNK